MLGNIIYTINIPWCVKIIIWKKKNKNIKLYLLNNSKVFKFIFIKNKIKVDKWSNSLIINRCKNVNSNNKTNNFINKFLLTWNAFYFNKIRFKGKGFRIKFFKKIKLIKLYFGKSHKTFYVIKKIIKKRINKYKFMVIGINKNTIWSLTKKIIKIKNINFYTLRGLRQSRQIIFKRKGKKGAYI